jgi:hypothetical protein
MGMLSRDERNRGTKYREFVKGIMRFKQAMKGETEGRVSYGNEYLRKSLRRRMRWKR